MAKILIVEDNAMIQKAVEMKLIKEGFDVVCANDGKEGIDKLNTEMPDIVLTDLMLPYFSGNEIVSAVKAITEKNIPVIVFSSMGQENVVEEAFELGADDYITKPFNLTEVVIRIRKQLKRG